MTERHKTKMWLKITCISIFCLFVIGYLSYEIQKVVFGPKIEIALPINGTLVSESLIEIVGKAKNINEISMNDRKIFIDEKGNFQEKILLSYGYNLLTFKASDKFGRKEEETLEIIYK